MNAKPPSFLSRSATLSMVGRFDLDPYHVCSQLSDLQEVTSPPWAFVPISAMDKIIPVLSSYREASEGQAK